MSKVSTVQTQLSSSDSSSSSNSSSSSIKSTSSIKSIKDITPQGIEEEAIQKIHDDFAKIKINGIHDIMIIAKDVMLAIENLGNLSGIQKKTLAIELLTKLINLSPLPGPVREILILSLSEIVQGVFTLSKDLFNEIESCSWWSCWVSPSKTTKK